MDNEIPACGCGNDSMPDAGQVTCSQIKHNTKGSWRYWYASRLKYSMSIPFEIRNSSVPYSLRHFGISICPLTLCALNTRATDAEGTGGLHDSGFSYPLEAAKDVLGYF